MTKDLVSLLVNIPGLMLMERMHLFVSPLQETDRRYQI